MYINRSGNSFHFSQWLQLFKLKKWLGCDFITYLKIILCYLYFIAFMKNSEEYFSVIILLGKFLGYQIYLSGFHIDKLFQNFYFRTSSRNYSTDTLNRTRPNGLPESFIQDAGKFPQIIVFIKLFAKL